MLLAKHIRARIINLHYCQHRILNARPSASVGKGGVWTQGMQMGKSHGLGLETEKRGEGNC